MFWAVDRGNDPSNGVWIYPIGLVILSLYNSIYVKAADNETENQMDIDSDVMSRSTL